MNRFVPSALVAFAMSLPLGAHAAKLILNEYNAVSGSNYLNGGDAFMDGDGNIPPPADAYFVYVDPTVGRLQFFPWDADQDFSPATASIFNARMALARKLYNIPETRTQYLAKVQELLDNAWQPGVYLNEMTRMRALIAPVLQASGMQQELRDMIASQRGLGKWINQRETMVSSQLAHAPPRVNDVQIVHPCDTVNGERSGPQSRVNTERDERTRR